MEVETENNDYKGVGHHAPVGAGGGDPSSPRRAANRPVQAGAALVAGEQQVRTDDSPLLHFAAFRASLRQRQLGARRHVHAFDRRRPAPSSLGRRSPPGGLGARGPLRWAWRPACVGRRASKTPKVDRASCRANHTGWCRPAAPRGRGRPCQGKLGRLSLSLAGLFLVLFFGFRGGQEQQCMLDHG